MAGYNGYSMSNNAVAAYENNEMPLSKWSKQNIIDVISSMINDGLETNLSLEEFRKQKKCVLETLLKYNSWHHTSSKYNETSFYRVSEDQVSKLDYDTIQHILKCVEEEKEQKQDKTFYYADVIYGEWEGTRKHPKLVETEAQALIVGDWAYIVSDYYVSKKKVSGNHFSISKKYSNRKPAKFDAEKVKQAKKLAKI